MNERFAMVSTHSASDMLQYVPICPRITTSYRLFDLIEVTDDNADEIAISLANNSEAAYYLREGI